MPSTIHTICLAVPFHMGNVNCYLLQVASGFVLIDTGSSNQRRELEAELDRLGCQPGQLKLILLTHGDFDHTGNAAYLRERFACPIAMHAADLGMAKDADMFFNRSKGNALLKALVPRFSGFRAADRFTPDLTVQDGFDLAEYGLAATVLGIPGHSKGSIGVLTTDGDFFCGDLLVSSKKPELNSLIDDPAAANASLQRLQSLEINLVYPGHGKPFPLEMVKKGNARAA
jgi:glyoxylase-like metal-dependent hydrolase (beta-lactamase superfamily II)